MLRRKPTPITLTPEDVTAYTDRRLHRQAAALGMNPNSNILTERRKGGDGAGGMDPNDELRPLPGEKVRGAGVRSREERIGVGR
ncbi:MAG: hypothetical protein M1817_005097 [Caeruleum heppii]|nr:MAG: hypothetical protein M1817_005097 [Caeruleum heppii]